jgi:nucleotide-binding universal stress UspA family protein
MSEAPGETPARPVIVSYDGSSTAIEALDFTAAVLPGARVLIVSVWRRITEEAIASGGLAPPAGDPAEANAQALRAATQAARDGAARAKTAGLEGEPLVLETTTPVWKAIEEVAYAEDALLIVCGTKRSGIKTVLPGDLANALVQHASRAVLVVPSGKAAAERRKQVERD